MSISTISPPNSILRPTEYVLCWNNLTNEQLIFVPFAAAKQKYTSFSICIEAIREPNLATYDIYSQNSVDFTVCLDHGRTAAQRHPETCRTVDELFDPGLQDVPPQHHVYRKCKVPVPPRDEGANREDPDEFSKDGEGQNVS